MTKPISYDDLRPQTIVGEEAESSVEDVWVDSEIHHIGELPLDAS